MEKTGITENVKRILAEIGPGVTLCAATKMNDAARVREAIAAGVKVCGENRVQEMLDKYAQGAYEGAELHFIGHLQKNKVKNVVGLVSLIQSVDSLSLLDAIDAEARKKSVVQSVLLEINIGREASKSGFSPEEIPAAVEHASALESIRVEGLMCIPPICLDPAENRPYFAEMHKIFVDIDVEKYDNISMSLLSAGMSGDYLEAVSCGSNMIRVGSGIFGPRHYNSPEVQP